MVLVREENKMGTMPIHRLVLNMSLPLIMVMVIQALYNVVDSYFVAKISQEALNAVSLSYPIQTLMIAVAVGTGVGVNALVSRMLGAKEYHRANQAARNGIFLSVMSYGIVGIVLAGFIKPFFCIQTRMPAVIELGSQYLSICVAASLGLFTSVMLDRILMSTGRTVLAMVGQGVGALVNIIMDPVLIFGVGIFPEMGVRGAALATVMGQTINAVISLVFNLFMNKDIRLTGEHFKPVKSIIKDVYIVGIPAMLINCIGAGMIFGMNQILIRFTDTAVAVLGIYFKIQNLIFLPALGLNNGIIPIISYNYGAKNRQRIESTIRFSIKIVVFLMAIGLTAVELFPHTILSLFSSSEEMMRIGIRAIRIMGLNFIFAGFSIVVSGVFQALKKGVHSMMFSLIRQFLLLLPCAFLLSLSGRLEYVWFAFPISEVATMVICLVCLQGEMKKILVDE